MQDAVHVERCNWACPCPRVFLLACTHAWVYGVYVCVCGCEEGEGLCVFGEREEEAAGRRVEWGSGGRSRKAVVEGGERKVLTICLHELEVFLNWPLVFTTRPLNLPCCVEITFLPSAL